MPDNDEKPVSLSGSPIYHHKAREREFEFATGSEDSEILEKHIEKYLGPIDLVWHEIISDLVHVDVHQIRATSDRPFHWLVTTGMSDRPMSPPPEAAECRFAELLIALPAEWPLDQQSFSDERNYWPIRLLKSLARLPHEYETWLWWAHSVPNGNPPERFADNVPFTGSILAPPLRANPEFFTCKVRPEKEVSFFSVIPLYDEEMTFKLRKGADQLFDKFDGAGVDELVNLRRKNVGKRWWQLGRT